MKLALFDLIEALYLYKWGCKCKLCKLPKFTILPNSLSYLEAWAQIPTGVQQLEMNGENEDQAEAGSGQEGRSEGDRGLETSEPRNSEGEDRC
jgi:hypothetical protein